jgi:hypothetical protein
VAALFKGDPIRVSPLYLKQPLYGEWVLEKNLQFKKIMREEENRVKGKTIEQINNFSRFKEKRI